MSNIVCAIVDAVPEHNIASRVNVAFIVRTRRSRGQAVVAESNYRRRSLPDCDRV